MSSKTHRQSSYHGAAVQALVVVLVLIDAREKPNDSMDQMENAASSLSPTGLNPIAIPYILTRLITDI